ncbi:MAG TPA: nicotinate-nucleotide adenylyltransferase [Bacteroidota bacterium]|nr:nicotinate-nucleotide adenylyltransferase [Bacteroidota bacterium]
MKLGIFGGTFDPVHLGHLIVAEAVRERAGLDRIVFIPASTPPHKADAPVSSAAHRLAMLREAVRSNAFFQVSDIEIERGGISYTVDTLRQLKEANAADDLYLLIGADNLREFQSWKEPEEILKQATLIVMNRPGFPAAPGGMTLPVNALQCEVPSIDISATEIRRRVQQGLTISYLVPSAVSRYIERTRLYRGA